MRTAVFVAALAASLTACTAADRMPPEAMASADPDACFYAEDVTGFRAPDERTVYVSTARGRTFRLDTLVDCNSARSAQTVGFRTPAGGDRVCRGADVDLLVPGAGAAGRCPVSAVTPLTAAEAEALPASARP